MGRGYALTIAFQALLYQIPRASSLCSAQFHLVNYSLEPKETKMVKSNKEVAEPSSAVSTAAESSPSTTGPASRPKGSASEAVSLNPYGPIQERYQAAYAWLATMNPRPY